MRKLKVRADSLLSVPPQAILGKDFQRAMNQAECLLPFRVFPADRKRRRSESFEGLPDHRLYPDPIRTKASYGKALP